MDTVSNMFAPAMSAIPDSRVPETIEPAGTRKPMRVLLVEDNPVNRRLATVWFKKRGHSVVTAEDGLKALEALRADSFDLILMDLEMPNLDGLGATRAIREMERKTGEHIPIIAMTAHAMTGDREKCLKAGMDDYVSKPINTDDLFKTIDSVVTRLKSALRDQG